MGLTLKHDFCSVQWSYCSFSNSTGQRTRHQGVEHLLVLLVALKESSVQYNMVNPKQNCRILPLLQHLPRLGVKIIFKILSAGNSWSDHEE